MTKKDMRMTVSREASRNIGKKLTDALRSGDVAAVQNACVDALRQLGPQSLVDFQMPPHTDAKPAVAQPPFNPEQEKLEKLVSNVATNIWRIKNQIFVEDDSGGGGETYKDALDVHVIGKIARYVNSLMIALKDCGIEIVSDFVGKPHREGSAVNVVSYEERKDCSYDQYIEVLMPTVRWTNSKRDTRLLQPAEVIVGRPVNPSAENHAETI